MITKLLLSGLGLALFLKWRKKTTKTSGVGKLNFIILCSRAQKLGIPLYVKYEELTKKQRDALKQLAHEYGYTLTKNREEKGLSLTEAFYKFLQTKYKSIRKVSGIGLLNRIPTGGQFPVYDEDGNVIATYYDFIERTPDSVLYSQALTAIDEATGDPKDYAYWQTIKYIANGGKFVWDDKKETKDGRVLLYGLESLLFGKGKKHPEERKKRRGMLAAPEKRGQYPEKFAESLIQFFPGGVDDYYLKEGVIDALRSVNSKADAAAEIMSVWGRDYEFEQAEANYEYTKGYEQYARENNLM